jgi:hypothetical protein
MACKHCGKKYHNCSSCGNEAYMWNYCSPECVRKSGRLICHVCNGWGCSYDPDIPHDHPDNVGENPKCEDGTVDLSDVTVTMDRECLNQLAQESNPTSAPVAVKSSVRVTVSHKHSSSKEPG